jgi:hypothetical protein
VLCVGLFCRPIHRRVCSFGLLFATPRASQSKKGIKHVLNPLFLKKPIKT